MLIHKIVTKVLSTLPEDVQFIDLDYIVSIGPAIPVAYDGWDVGESNIHFTVYLKLGDPICIVIRTGTSEKFTDLHVKFAHEERNKLIEAWEQRKGIKVE